MPGGEEVEGAIAPLLGKGSAKALKKNRARLPVWSFGVGRFSQQRLRTRCS